MSYRPVAMVSGPCVRSASFQLRMVWSAWRGGATPTVAEATAAVIFYAEHDAYQPV